MSTNNQNPEFQMSRSGKRLYRRGKPIETADEKAHREALALGMLADIGTEDVPSRMAARFWLAGYQAGVVADKAAKLKQKLELPLDVRRAINSAIRNAHSRAKLALTSMALMPVPEDDGVEPGTEKHS